MPKEVKYGYLRGVRVFIDAVELVASIVFTNEGGKFVKDSTNRLDIAGSGDTNVLGWAEHGALTGSSTAGQDNAQVDISDLSMYRIPADATPASTILLDTCDLIVASNIQKADIGESNEDIIRIFGIDITAVTVDVTLYKLKITASGVA